MSELPQAAQPEQVRTSPWAIWALVLGGLGLCCFPVGLVGAGLGIAALVKLEKDRSQSGKGLAIAGLAIGVSSVVLNGILAALAVPAFIGYVRRSKTTEVTSNLNAIYARLEERHGQQGGIESIALTPGEIPCGNPHAWTAEELARFAGLGFAPAGPTNYSYEVVASPPDVPDAVAVIRGHGDLDCDGQTSLFELAVGKDDGGELKRARGFTSRTRSSSRPQRASATRCDLGRARRGRARRRRAGGPRTARRSP
ncbi:MAG TPA: DUF4190 domain-containing protein [Polyangiales bacterium]|nr:DUF4190 domain-containing protein [Polyangiales bacterium]